MIQTKTISPVTLRLTREAKRPVVYFDAGNRNASYELKEHLLELFRYHRLKSSETIVLCIGSDRSTGDSLGPLVGYKLEKYSIPNVHIYGTLNKPVHAANLSENLEEIKSSYRNPFVIAIEASLGTKEHIGYITLGNGPLRPGLGVNKSLPTVGDIHITGIVNFSGVMESLLLQTTRLSNVMLLADTISRGVLYGILESSDF